MTESLIAKHRGHLHGGHLPPDTIGAPFGDGVDDRARWQVKGDFPEKEGQLGATEQDDAAEVELYGVIGRLGRGSAPDLDLPQSPPQSQQSARAPAPVTNRIPKAACRCCCCCCCGSWCPVAAVAGRYRRYAPWCGKGYGGTAALATESFCPVEAFRSKQGQKLSVPEAFRNLGACRLLSDPPPAHHDLNNSRLLSKILKAARLDVTRSMR